jgi:hypothetical protein
LRVWIFKEERNGDGRMLKRRIISKKITGISILIVVLMMSMIFSAWGYSDGRWDRAQTGCECHSSTADPTVTADISGIPTDYTPSQTYPLTVTVSGGPATPEGGFNLEVSQGVLSTTDLNVQINVPGNQATHTNSNQRSWIVNWQAPVSGSGSVTFWAAGNAVNGNGNNGGDGWNLFSSTISQTPTSDTFPPEIRNVQLNGASSQTYSLSTIPVLTLTAIIDDSVTGNSDIGGANFTQDPHNWGTAQTMTFQNPPTSPTEAFTATITPPVKAGSYVYYVYAWDSQPNNNITNKDENATLTIIDDVSPEITDVQIDGLSSKVVLSGAEVTITAQIDDSQSGNSNIQGANFTIGSAQWTTATFLNTLDSTYDSPTEDVTRTINTTGWLSGTYDLYVYAQDDVPNYNTTSIAYATLIISSELVPPEISDVTIDGFSTKTLMKGATVTLKAIVDDSNTGNSDIGGVNFTMGEANWSSSSLMNALDSAFDSSQEEVVKSIDTSDWAPGSYRFYVYAWDSAEPSNNHNFTSIAFSTLIIRSAPSNVAVTPGVDLGELIINWESETADDITGYRIYRSQTQGSGYTLVASVDTTNTSYIDKDLHNEKMYYYVMTSYDEGGNETIFSGEASGTTIPKATNGPDEPGDFPWLVIVVLIIIIILIVLLLLWRKKAGSG